MTRPRDALDHALLALAAEGQRPRCADPPAGGDHPWLSSNAEQRTRAARACASCPLIEPCARAGADEAHGVWGGIDRTATTGKRNQ